MERTFAKHVLINKHLRILPLFPILDVLCHHTLFYILGFVKSVKKEKLLSNFNTT